MSKWNIVFATSKSHFGGAKALLNSFKLLYNNDDRIKFHILQYDIDQHDLDLIKSNFHAEIHKLDPKIDKIWACKIERFKYASQLDGIVMLMDSDMFFLAGDIRPYFYLAEHGYIVAGANGSNFGFNQGWREKYQIPEIPDFYLDKTITSVPTFMDTRLHGKVWMDLYTHKNTKKIGADFDLQNIFMVLNNKLPSMVVLSPQQVTGIHHFQLKPDTRVRKVQGKWICLDGTVPLIVHGKWFSPGWVENLMKPMVKYCRGEAKYIKGAEESRALLKEEFDRLTNMPLDA